MCMHVPVCVHALWMWCTFNSLLNKLDHMLVLFLIYHAEICFYFCLMPHVTSALFWEDKALTANYSLYAIERMNGRLPASIQSENT